MLSLNASFICKINWHLAGLTLICICWAGHAQNGQEQGDPLSQIISYLTSEQPEVQLAAADALGKIGDSRAIDPLVATLKGTDPYLRQSAARALGLIGDPCAAGPLTAAMNDPDPSVRRLATEALAEINMPETAEHRRAALQDSDASSTAHLREVEAYLQVVRQKEAEVSLRAGRQIGANMRTLISQSGTEGSPEAIRQKEAEIKRLPGTAMVYVYRSDRARKGDWPEIYLNGEVLTISLYASNYVFQVVPQGRVVVTSDLAPPNGDPKFWATLPGCSNLNLEHIYMAGQVGYWGQLQAPKCEESLRETMARMSSAPRDSLPQDLVDLCGLRIEPGDVGPGYFPGTIVVSTAGIDPNEWGQCYGTMDYALKVLTKAVGPTRIEFDAEAGQSYYVRWSAKSAGKMELVDAASASNEVRRLDMMKY